MRWPWEKRDRGADAVEIAGQEISAAINRLASVLSEPTIAMAITNAREPVRRLPSHQVIPCPDCGGERPKFSLLLLHPDGEMLACQQCPARFCACLNAEGRVVTFRSHANSAPFGAPVAANAAEPPREPARPLMPMPRERPA